MSIHRLLFVTLYVILQVTAFTACSNPEEQPSEKASEPVLFKSDHVYFQYTGRIDFSNSELPRFWAPGVYIRAKFSGPSCEVILYDEMLWGNSHNYVSVVIDNRPVERIKLTAKSNTLKYNNLGPGEHSILICKSTESGIGYLEFGGLRCEALLPSEKSLSRRIEFIGNSITCGMGSDESVTKCGQGEWYDQHNAYMSYGAQAARMLEAEWMLTAVSGIGLIHSCCDMTLTMPPVYDKINLRENKLPWNFSNYSPDVVTICLGQNDGIQDSVKFCNMYVDLVKKIRSNYPKASIVCLTSPMGDASLTAALKNYLTSVTSQMKKSGDENVHSFYFAKQYIKGCGAHPGLSEHGEIARELSGFIRQIKNW